MCIRIPSQPAVLDIRTHLKRKRTITDGELVASDTVSTEKLYAVCENSRGLSDADVPMHRLSDVNMERLSRGSLTSVEFNRAYRIVMTASADTTMALFSVGVCFFWCNAYSNTVRKVRESFVG